MEADLAEVESGGRGSLACGRWVAVCFMSRRLASPTFFHDDVERRKPRPHFSGSSIHTARDLTAPSRVGTGHIPPARPCSVYGS